MGTKFAKAWLFAGLVSFTLTSHAQAKDMVLQPTSPWKVNYADENCDLARTFGTGSDAIALHIIRFVPGDDFQMGLVGEAVQAWTSAHVLRLQFGPSELAIKVYLDRATTADGQKLALLTVDSIGGDKGIVKAGKSSGNKGEKTRKPIDAVNPYQVTKEREQAVSRISVLGGLLNRITLETGSLGEPMEALRKCNAELLGHWNIDVEKHRQLSRLAQPIGDPHKWLTWMDYPPEMLDWGKRGFFRFRFTVEPSGIVSNCTLMQSIMPRQDAQATCEKLKSRARFEPALDADGKPIRSFWVRNARFL